MFCRDVGLFVLSVALRPARMAGLVDPAALQLVPWVRPEQLPSMEIPGNLSAMALCQIVWGSGATL